MTLDNIQETTMKEYKLINIVHALLNICHIFHEKYHMCADERSAVGLCSPHKRTPRMQVQILAETNLSHVT